MTCKHTLKLLYAYAMITAALYMCLHVVPHRVAHRLVEASKQRKPEIIVRARP